MENFLKMENMLGETNKKRRKNMNKNKKEEEQMENIIDEIEEEYPFKWIDNYTCIDVEDIRYAKISHNGSGNFVILFYSKTNNEPIEIFNKYIQTEEDARFFIHIILQTYELNVFDFEYFKEHPEEFENG